ncbi:MULTISPECIES: hypothetical protein [unclassified Streptomyces]|uniref:hypothetical protein n=1 Tax=unclassified Streptomyces TaxID=2593676 RepID=UPI0022530659|nr:MULTISPECIES: hypothetical protein [unclassified Streptomyces]MCX5047647.1 hypothetical protein [Streptomyces sp. NBC_00474]MCX5057665.1 hypothetical protein [Streptomyces sp. NBC_00452]MCX5245458.1 hypothetical protein [Streptomyces sp. NBC_00201]MCX5288764.1 hypothetical protein [Streptomyces sp. NBC_00183]
MNSHHGTTHKTDGRIRTAHGPWAALCAAAAVILGPAAVTASALDQANAAPMHHAVRADEMQAYVPSDTGRRRTSVA